MVLHTSEPHFLLGLFSFILSSSQAILNYLAACLMAGLPSNSIPLGSFPSGEMFLILRISSESSLKVENILLILATDYILPFICSLLMALAFPSSWIISSMFTSSYSSPTSEHFFTMVYSMLDTFSAKNGSDHENTLSPSGNLYGGSVS